MKNLDNQLGSKSSKSKIVQSKSNNASSYSSKILALVYLSSSELNKVIPNWNEPAALEALEDEQKFMRMLFEAGIDIKLPIEHQVLQHRNRFNEVVHCSRWVGHERQDKQWIQSGYASKEAVDKALNSKLLDSSYRSRALTVDVQEMLEEKDRRSKLIEDVEDVG